MFTNGRHLHIFEAFRIDHNLPKHKKPKQKSYSKSMMKSVAAESSVTAIPGAYQEEGYIEEEKSMGDYVVSTGVNVTWNEALSRGNGVINISTKSTWIEAFKRVIRRKPKPKITIEQFFTSIKNSVEELTVVQERAAGYEQALRAAKQSGQIALQEKLEDAIMVVRAETQLISTQNLKYITEDTLVSFAEKAKPGLALDWICNFTRMIPQEVLVKKQALDEHKIFDNYVVLHYDPQGTGRKDTKAEIAARKDPILFGVLKERRRLYYVGDWVDEFCDLTLDAIADALGTHHVQLLKKDVY